MDAAVAADSRTAALLHRLASQRGGGQSSPHGTPVVNSGPQSSDITHHPRVIAKAIGPSGSTFNAPGGNRPTPLGQWQQSVTTAVPSRPAQAGSEHRRSGHHRASTAPSEQASTSLHSLRGSSFQASAVSGKTSISELLNSRGLSGPHPPSSTINNHSSSSHNSNNNAGEAVGRQLPRSSSHHALSGRVGSSGGSGSGASGAAEKGASNGGGLPSTTAGRDSLLPVSGTAGTRTSTIVQTSQVSPNQPAPRPLLSSSHLGTPGLIPISYLTQLPTASQALSSAPPPVQPPSISMGPGSSGPSRDMRIRGRSAIALPPATKADDASVKSTNRPPKPSKLVLGVNTLTTAAEAPSRHGGSTRIAGTSSLLVSSLAKTSHAQYSCREPLTRPDLVLHFNDTPTDGIMFAHLRDEPAALVVSRRLEERALNPERLNLDRRQLTACPILENEARLRLLNYQNNYITEIKNIFNLPNLIFLDLYNNCIQEIGDCLSCVTTLRVLMLGKNRIKSIANIDRLAKLDVLDLHSNQVTKLEKLDTLTELRVLNLAGNQISVVQNLSNLRSLTELNLRRNQISAVQDLHPLPVLQRVFLSNNCLTSLDAASSLFTVRYLVELALDGNPIATQNPAAYRRYVLDRVRTLRQLDLKRISEDERKAASSERRREEAAKKAAEAQLRAEQERKDAILAMEKQWTEHLRGSGGLVDETALPGQACQPNSAYTQGPVATMEPSGGTARAWGAQAQQESGSYGYGNFMHMLAAAGARGAVVPMGSASGGRPLTSPLWGMHTQTQTQGAVAAVLPLPPKMGYFEVEMHPQMREKSLQIYGESWECLEQPKLWASVTEVLFKFVTVERIAERAMPLILQRFERLYRLRLAQNHLCSLEQLRSLHELLSKVTELEIEDNPICRLSILRAYVSVWLPNVSLLNGSALSQADRDTGALLFSALVACNAQGTGTLPPNASAPQPPCQPPPPQKRASPSPRANGEGVVGLAASQPPPSDTPAPPCPSAAPASAWVGKAVGPSVAAGMGPQQMEADALASAMVRDTVATLLAHKDAEQAFEAIWPECISGLIQGCMDTLEDLDNYMKTCLTSL